jgi:putative oxidoreductase
VSERHGFIFSEKGSGLYDRNTASNKHRLRLHFPSNHRWNHYFPLRNAKLFVWFGGWGIKKSLEQLTLKTIPKFVAWLVIVGQSFGSIALVTGFLGRIAAGGLFIIFTGALIVHLPDGWTMNWFGEKKGEGIEYHVMLLSLLLIVIVKGSGAMSIDLWLFGNMHCT